MTPRFCHDQLGMPGAALPVNRSATTPSTKTLEAALRPTWFVDCEAPSVRRYAQQVVAGLSDPVEKGVRLFYAVRDDIRYSAYDMRLDRESFRASHVLSAGFGWCVTKSCLLAAVCRAVDVPCRLGYADVRNHLATEKLLAVMGTDTFYYHGYNELWLDGRWVKATVAFNRSLCEKARLKPLEFDGRHDSLYHPFDLEGRRHMEYLHDYGSFLDVPYEAILARFDEAYPSMREMIAQRRQLSGDFEAEIAAESARRESER